MPCHCDGLSQRNAMARAQPTWTCISQCGACCRLAPDERPEALDALSAEQRELYLSMVGEDGWCRHYDSGGRRCRIYNDRPDFCRVSSLADLFEVPADQANGFAIACCNQQIRSLYGGRSSELRRFKRAVNRSEDRDA